MGVTELIRRAWLRDSGAHSDNAPGRQAPGTQSPSKRKESGYEGFSWMGSIWLVYSVFFIIDPIARRSTRHWIALAVVYPTFLAIYFSFFRVRTPWLMDRPAGKLHRSGARQRLIIALSMFLLGMGYIPFNDSAGGIIVYAAAYLPFILESVPLIFFILTVGSAVLALEGHFLHLNLWSWLTGVLFGFIVAISNLAVARQKRADSKLRMAQEEIEHLAKVAERERIARDLHDVLGHTLSVIVLKAELAGRLLKRDSARSALEIADVEQIARKALAEVREAIGGYRSEGLVAEIERAHRTLDAAGVELQCETRPPKLSPAEETVISLVLREAVTNIVRHAGAQRCELGFSETAGHHAVVIYDDGCGGVRAEGNGLRGMRERIEALGGLFSVEAVQGTRLMIQLPVTENGDARILAAQLPGSRLTPGDPAGLYFPDTDLAADALTTVSEPAGLPAREIAAS